MPAGLCSACRPSASFWIVNNFRRCGCGASNQRNVRKRVTKIVETQVGFPKSHGPSSKAYRTDRQHGKRPTHHHHRRCCRKSRCIQPDSDKPDSKCAVNWEGFASFSIVAVSVMRCTTVIFGPDALVRISSVEKWERTEEVLSTYGIDNFLKGHNFGKSFAHFIQNIEENSFKV